MEFAAGARLGSYEILAPFIMANAADQNLLAVWDHRSRNLTQSQVPGLPRSGHSMWKFMETAAVTLIFPSAMVPWVAPAPPPD